MTNHAAFQATYADWKLIRTRKTVQVVFELPLEAADAAYKVLGGMPNSAEETWFAIARLNGKPTEREKPDKRKWDDLPPATQAAIRCGEKAFIKFLIESKYVDNTSTLSDEEVSKRFIYKICDIKSRGELATNPLARGHWYKLDENYQAWLREPGVTG